MALTQQEVHFPFPISYYLSADAYDTRLIPNSAGSSLTWLSMSKEFRKGAALKLFRDTPGLKDYLLLSLDMSQCHSRIASSFIDAPTLREMLRERDMWKVAARPVLSRFSFDKKRIQQGAL